MLWTVDMHKSTNPRLLWKEHGDSEVVWVKLVEVGMDKAFDGSWPHPAFGSVDTDISVDLHADFNFGRWTLPLEGPRGRGECSVRRDLPR